ncbi:DUF1761 domain-containing protein [Microbacterium suwonense]|uniref:DUF1761 domain-containing protein n=1 Tax=Microbacterium suwonense TaxID=683047 RepID=A0ABM8FVM1_9MICO|nr:DUF1761 domain-containing protein [Microbacterium suwonense]BDZ39704.1 hypothetical protein GCM10025863_23180 [Microbacterium suwonense]
MTIPEINYWAVLIATVASMIVGAIWYARGVMGARWAKLADVDLDKPSRGVLWPMITTVIVTFITAWVLAGASSIAWHFYEGSYFWASLVTAVMLWAGFTAARLITHDAFEGRSTKLTTLNIAHELITVLVMAVVIGVWPPAGI